MMLWITLIKQRRNLMILLNGPANLWAKSIKLPPV
nr:MAG TPA: hypothetical protein [Caudoviricetes sp.]